MNGKSKCKLLKEIRKQIARSNDIAYVTSECKYQGECTGTCPKCEAEVRYLEQELSKRRQLGKTVAIAGVAAALMVGMSGCGLSEQPEQTLPESEPSQTATKGLIDPTYEELEGKIPETTAEHLLGEVPYELIMGNVDLSSLESEPG